MATQLLDSGWREDQLPPGDVVGQIIVPSQAWTVRRLELAPLWCGAWLGEVDGLSGDLVAVELDDPKTIAAATAPGLESLKVTDKCRRERLGESL